MAKPTPRCTTCRIKNCSILRNCKTAILEEISDNKTYLHYKKGETLLIEGEPGGGIYFIQSGIAKVELNGKNGRPLILRLAGEGSVFGHRVAAASFCQPLTVVAAGPLHVCYLSLHRFNETVEKSSALREAVFKSILDELKQVETQSLCLSHKSVKERVAGMLLHIASVYQYKPGGRSIHLQLERQEMADMIATTKEQVSKILAELQQAAIIKFRAKHFKYFDLTALEEIAAINKPEAYQ